jgi:protein-tyrosine phosphatase
VFHFPKEKNMSRGSHHLSSLLLATALASSLVGIGCAEHHPVRVYDPYYTDYHVWDDNEVVYYRQWADETHRDHDRDFKRLNKDEQKEYWTWRHNHGDHDHDKDHDHH